MKRCDQCEVMCINGVRCHEIGCPVAWKDYKIECKNCKRAFVPKVKGQDCCTQQCRREYWGL